MIIDSPNYPSLRLLPYLFSIIYAPVDYIELYVS